jgi:hypothetical protein
MAANGEGRRPALLAFVRDEIEHAGGAIHIQKSSGMLVARKG